MPPSGPCVPLLLRPLSPDRQLRAPASPTEGSLWPPESKPPPASFHSQQKPWALGEVTQGLRTDFRCAPPRSDAPAAGNIPALVSWGHLLR